MRSNPDLDRLVVKLKEMRVEYEKYFNGALDVPPGELRFAIKSQIQRLRETVKGSADSFRLTSIEAQFNSYNELFNRRLRDQEEGRKPVKRVAPEHPAYDANKGVLVQEKVEEGAMAALYEQLYGNSKKHVDPKSFQTYLERQVSLIREKTGCSQVQFRIANEGGQMKLKARPISDPKKG